MLLYWIHLAQGVWSLAFISEGTAVVELGR
jgi:hypothetical protein